MALTPSLQKTRKPAPQSPRGSQERSHINRELPTATASSWTDAWRGQKQPGAVAPRSCGAGPGWQSELPGADAQENQTLHHCRLVGFRPSVPRPVPAPPLPDRFPPQPRTSTHSPPRAAFRPAGLPQEVNRRHVRPRPADGGRRAAAAVEMLLPPALYSRLAGTPGAAEPLPVERSPAAGAAPFRFTPRPVRFPRDHEFFEVRENLCGRFPEPPHPAGRCLGGQDCRWGRG